MTVMEVKGGFMDSIHINELKVMLIKAREWIDHVLDGFDNKIIVGEISHPFEKKPKVKRAYRKREDPAPFPDAPTIITTGEGSTTVDRLPDDDKGNPFYSGKPKRGRKTKKDVNPDQS